MADEKGSQDWYDQTVGERYRQMKIGQNPVGGRSGDDGWQYFTGPGGEVRVRAERGGRIVGETMDKATGQYQPGLPSDFFSSGSPASGVPAGGAPEGGQGDMKFTLDGRPVPSGFFQRHLEELLSQPGGEAEAEAILHENGFKDWAEYQENEVDKYKKYDVFGGAGLDDSRWDAARKLQDSYDAGRQK